MKFGRHTSRAESEARSIAANVMMEGHSLTLEQLEVIADVIDGKKDADQMIREHKAALAARVQPRR